MKNGSKAAMIVVLLLVILFGVGQFFAASVAPTAQNQGQGEGTASQGTQTQTPTKILAYVPPVFASGPPVESGSCWTSSIAAPYRKDAWRCAVGNGISDPCFQVQNSSDLICGVNPKRSGSEFLLQL